MAFAVQCALVSASPVQLQSERASTASSSSHRVRVSVRDSSFLQTKFSGSAFQPPTAKKQPAGTTLVVRAQRVNFKANRTVTIPFREGEFAADEYLKETERVVKVTFPDSTRIEYLGDQKWRSRLRPLTFINVTATPTVEVRVSFEKGSLRLYSDTLSLDFTGVPDSFAVADFSFLLDGSMRAVPRSPGAVTVRHNCDFTGSVSLGMSTDLPAAFALIPEGIVTGAGDEILDRIIGAMEGALLQGIIRDYNIWSRMKSRKSVAKKQPLRTSSTEGSQDSLTEDETWMSEERLAAEERRLAEEQSRRRQEELVRQALEEARIKKEGELLFQMSQRAYGRGVYDKSVEMLEAALTKVPGNSNLGGEIQVWLAMAYDAVGRHADCIALYKQLEGSHPNKILRKQAADLRYIAEAPKLKISRDEMVKIPLIEKDYDRKAKTWSQLVKEKRKKPMNKSAAQTKDYLEDWLVWTPPRWEKSPYFWVAVTIWLTMVGVSLVFQN